MKKSTSAAAKEIKDAATKETLVAIKALVENGKLNSTLWSYWKSFYDLKGGTCTEVAAHIVEHGTPEQKADPAWSQKIFRNSSSYIATLRRQGLLRSRLYHRL